jgi:2-polyprenyl-3-methyl-5-hydroxy-6-metoxy-1,4-benzoquinol methylase
LRGKLSIAKCAECGHRWLLNSAEQHREVELTVYTDVYAGYRADPVFETSVREIITEKFLRLVPPPATALDVGCGSGDFMIAAREAGYDIEGMDISPASSAICTSRGLKAVAGDFLTHDFGRTFDLITMWDLVEHLREPGTFLERAKALLSPNGLLFAKIPVFGDLSVTCSALAPRAAGMLLGAPDHVQYFTRKSLTRLCADAGFDALSLEPTGGIREKRTGGSMKRRLGRQVASTIKGVSGDYNILLMARAA